MFYSPLRYPGGKNRLVPLIKRLISDNGLTGCSYAEPFAGGASVALALLLDGFAKKVYINDIDPAVYAFWHCVLNETEAFVSKIVNSPLRIEEWHRQKEILKRKVDVNLLDLGFSFFFLNRTNRSGIINGGVIGGLDQQGNWLMDCRFNRDALSAKIEKIAEFRHQISISCQDSEDFMRSFRLSHEQMFFYIDPPYFEKGKRLYTNFYNEADHKALASFIKSDLSGHWVVTYDNHPFIRDIYKPFPIYEFELDYSAAGRKTGREVLIHSKDLQVSQDFLRQI